MIIGNNRFRISLGMCIKKIEPHVSMCESQGKLKNIHQRLGCFRYATGECRLVVFISRNEKSEGVCKNQIVLRKQDTHVLGSRQTGGIPVQYGELPV